MNDNTFEKAILYAFAAFIIGSLGIIGYVTPWLIDWVVVNVDVFHNVNEHVGVFAELHPFLVLIITAYVFIGGFFGSFMYVTEFMSMCGNWSFKKVFMWFFLWLPLIFYYLFNFNLHKCCRCKETKHIEVRYENGQQFCYECWKARFEEPHTCSTCGERKLLYIFNDDGTKQCKECNSQ